MNRCNSPKKIDRTLIVLLIGAALAGCGGGASNAVVAASPADASALEESTGAQADAVEADDDAREQALRLRGFNPVSTSPASVIAALNTGVSIPTPTVVSSIQAAPSTTATSHTTAAASVMARPVTTPNVQIAAAPMVTAAPVARPAPPPAIPVTAQPTQVSQSTSNTTVRVPATVAVTASPVTTQSAQTPAVSTAAPQTSETNPSAVASLVWDKVSNRGATLDLRNAVLTLDDEFDAPSITNKTGGGPWFAPIHTGFGGAKFMEPSANGPFSYANSAVTIRMQKTSSGWQSGLFQSVDALGRGFSQKYGIFEMRAKFPKGLSSWPGFWLKTVNQFTNKSETQGEVDIIEAYGGNDHDGYHTTVHLWPASRPAGNLLTQHRQKSGYTTVNADMFDGQFHTYTAEISPDFITIYFDRGRILRMVMLPEFRKPMFLLVDLAYLASETRPDNMPADMIIDYVKVWQRPEWR